MTSNLGSKQKAVLSSLHQHGGEWTSISGWVWDTPGGTDRVLASLVRRGLVARIGNGQFGYGHYRITDAGVAEAAKLPHAPF